MKKTINNNSSVDGSYYASSYSHHKNVYYIFDTGMFLTHFYQYLRNLNGGSEFVFRHSLLASFNFEIIIKGMPTNVCITMSLDEDLIPVVNIDIFANLSIRISSDWIKDKKLFFMTRDMIDDHKLIFPVLDYLSEFDNPISMALRS